MRRWSDTIYLQAYGIPEMWLSLFSQTTRLANIVDIMAKQKLQARNDDLLNSLEERGLTIHRLSGGPHRVIRRLQIGEWE